MPECVLVRAHVTACTGVRGQEVNSGNLPCPFPTLFTEVGTPPGFSEFTRSNSPACELAPGIPYP